MLFGQLSLPRHTVTTDMWQAAGHWACAVWQGQVPGVTRRHNVAGLFAQYSGDVYPACVPECVCVHGSTTTGSALILASSVADCLSQGRVVTVSPPTFSYSLMRPCFSHSWNVDQSWGWALSDQNVPKAGDAG